ncbi:MAG: OmpA family protein [Vibrio sp.]
MEYKRNLMLLTQIGLLSTAVYAETENTFQSHLFLGIKGGYQHASDDVYSYSSPKGGMLGVFGGLELSPSWSWDLGYQYHDDLYADVTSVNVKTWLIESALRYDWYLQEDFSLYGRVGMAYWDMDKTQNSSSKLDATGFSPLGEIGVSYKVTPSLNLSAGYQYIDSIGTSNIGKYDSHVALVSLTYVFGNKAQPASVETGLVIEDKAVPSKETVAESLPRTLIFPSQYADGFWGVNSTQISPDLNKGLSELASVLIRYPQARVHIVGHTDSKGLAKHNQILSEKRAQAVENKLIELGVSPTQIRTKGEGESNPIADNATAEGRAQNRRVEVTIPKFNFQK